MQSDRPAIICGKRLFEIATILAIVAALGTESSLSATEVPISFASSMMAGAVVGASIRKKLSDADDEPNAPTETNQNVRSALARVLEESGDLVALFDSTGNIHYLNGAARSNLHLHLPDNELSLFSLPLEEFVTGDDRDQLLTIGVRSARQEGRWKGSISMRRRTGEVFPVSLELMVHADTMGLTEMFSFCARDESDRMWFDQQIEQTLVMVNEYSVQIDVQRMELMQANAELERAKARLEELATTDGLTGLKNHRSFQERLGDTFKQTLRYRNAFSVVLLDVDHFKKYNDSFGHPAGDTVLRKVAKALQMCCRETDFVARYGGEEFVLILPETDRNTAELVAERVRGCVASLPWEERKVTVSVGFSTWHPGVLEAAQLVEQADQALYASKEAGRNRVTFYDPFSLASGYVAKS